VGGVATIAGGVLVAYADMGVDAGHLLAASVMSAPAAFVCAKVMTPETETPETVGTVMGVLKKKYRQCSRCCYQRAADGLQLALNVGAMFLAFIALIVLINGFIGGLGGLGGIESLTFQQLLGWLFAPVA